jgi:hypothetical protein
VHVPASFVILPQKILTQKEKDAKAAKVADKAKKKTWLGQTKAAATPENLELLKGWFDQVSDLYDGTAQQRPCLPPSPSVLTLAAVRCPFIGARHVSAVNYSVN